ncbi:hypothetical protein F5146DRAFT_1125993 [Armillaria mellea]|nr:hypothetical protein F5146DRAFT_1125993 [Armillaria mellea]
MARISNPLNMTTKGTKSEIWKWYHESGKYFKGNGTHKEARCKGCIENRVKELKAVDDRKIDLGVLERTEARDRTALHKEAISDVRPISGKIDNLKRHLQRCDYAEEAAKNWVAGENAKKEIALLDISEEGRLEDGAPNPAIKSSLKQATFAVVQSKPLNRTQQTEFNSDLLKFFVATNLAWNAMSNPYVRYFFGKWIPGAHLPHRKQLSGHILDAEVDAAMEETITEVKDQYGTGMVDGWSTKKDAIQTTGCNVLAKEYPCNIHVTTPERKTAANLLRHVLEDIQIMTKVWGVLLVAWCCDSGGDSKGLRRLLLEIMPWIITIPCWAHQVPS